MVKVGNHGFNRRPHMAPTTRSSMDRPHFARLIPDRRGRNQADLSRNSQFRERRQERPGIVCRPQSTRYHVRGSLHRVTVSETGMAAPDTQTSGHSRARGHRTALNGRPVDTATACSPTKPLRSGSAMATVPSSIAQKTHSITGALTFPPAAIASVLTEQSFSECSAPALDYRPIPSGRFALGRFSAFHFLIPVLLAAR